MSSSRVQAFCTDWTKNNFEIKATKGACSSRKSGRGPWFDLVKNFVTGLREGGVPFSGQSQWEPTEITAYLHATGTINPDAPTGDSQGPYPQRLNLQRESQF